MIEKNSENTTTLYRIENPNIPAVPNGMTSHEDLVGQWFSPNIHTALIYARKSTKKSKETGKPVNGTRLVVAHVPDTVVSDLHVSRHPIASSMDVENDNYIVPRDGTYPVQQIDLDPIIGELRGELGRLDKYSEAKRRVILHLGEILVRQ